MKSGLRLLFITLPLVLLGAGFVAYVVANKPAPQQVALVERATPVRVIIAQQRPVSPQVIGFGLVRPARTHEAISQVGGVAVYVNPALQKGAILPADSLLLRLSPANFDLAIAQADANIRAATARLAEILVSESNLISSLEIEQKTLALKENSLERVEKLFDGGTASRATLDNAQAALLAQTQKVLSIENSLALMPTQRAVQSEQIAVYQANLATAALNLERTELTLPFAARVATVSVEVGQFVRSGTTAALLDGIEAAEVEAQVSPSAMRALMPAGRRGENAVPIDLFAMTDMLHALGLTATVRLRLGQDVVEWAATVDRISDTIDQKTGTIGVIVRVEDAYRLAEPGTRPPLTKGMFVEVTLNSPPIEGVVIPRGALRDGFVMLADDGDRLVLKPVAPLMVQGDIALIADGLKPGARVLVGAPSPAIAGMLLIVTQDSELMAQLAGAGQAR
ncbi:MAG: efflux RND transporter periplasmic adaptor subunit [Paracoccaceae bacterium]